MDLPSHTIMMLTTTLVLYICLRHFVPILALILVILIPAIFIVWFSKPDEEEKLEEVEAPTTVAVEEQ